MKYSIIQEKNLFATHVAMYPINIILNKRMLLYRTFLFNFMK